MAPTAMLQNSAMQIRILSRVFENRKSVSMPIFGGFPFFSFRKPSFENIDDLGFSDFSIVCRISPEFCEYAGSSSLSFIASTIQREFICFQKQPSWNIYVQLGAMFCHSSGRMFTQPLSE
jgi:hypothetical protein